MWLDKRADELFKGDVLLNTGATVQQVVPSHKGAKTYLHVVFEDGYTQSVTTDSDTIVAIYIPGE